MATGKHSKYYNFQMTIRKSFHVSQAVIISKLNIHSVIFSLNKY